MPSTIERVVIEAITPGENSASISVLFGVLGVGVLLNLFFWILTDSIHFLILGILTAALFILFGKFRSIFDSDLIKLQEQKNKEISKKDD